MKIVTLKLNWKYDKLRQMEGTTKPWP